MHLIVCLDERDGMLFNCRRQSSDRLLRERLLETVGTGRLWMNGYSARQFGEAAPDTVDEAFWERAQAGDAVFAENVDVALFAHRVTRITVYRWDKVYPADTVFPWTLFPTRQLERTEEFAGYSHETITEEVYRL